MALYTNCIANNIVYLRCCVSNEAASYASKIKYGIKCSPQTKYDIMFKQALLDKLMCINYNELDNECLSEAQIQTILDYLFSTCHDCNRQTT